MADHGIASREQPWERAYRQSRRIARAFVAGEYKCDRSHPHPPCATLLTPSSLQHHQPSASARRVPEADTDRNSKDEQHPGNTINEPSGDASAVIPESVDVDQTPHTSSQARRPRLSSSKSAPATQMDAMLQPSPSQQAFRDMTRAESFHGYSGGDTQPMESQVYRDYTASMSRASNATTTPQKKEKTVLYISPDGKLNTYDNTVTTDKTPMTCAEGETGFIDLASAWQQEGSQDARSTTSDIEELPASPQTQLHAPEGVQKSTMPETPSMAGHKRSRSGEILTSATATTKKTPAFSQLFGGGAQKRPVMSATQLFDQTQAPSSPLPDAPRSDPVVTRPSPNVNNQFSLSSPEAIMSSPVATMHGRPSSSIAGEPRDNYTSMHESQERRAARFRAEFGLPALEEEDQDNGDSQQRHLAQMRRQRTLSDRAMSDWAKLKAPSRPGSRPTSSRKQVATIDLVTPATTRRGERVEFSISDDEEDDVDEDLPMNEEEDMPLRVDEDTNNQEQDDDDVYDELGQTVLRSQRDDWEDDDEERGSEDGSVMHDDVPDDGVNKADANAMEWHSPSKPVVAKEPGHASGNQEPAVTATQHSAIVDSQSGQRQLRNPTQTKHASEQALSSSFVPGSQYAGKTSQEQAHMRASGLRQSAASQIQTSEKVPSSPPLPEVGSTLAEGSADASAARRDLLAQFQQQPQPGPSAAARAEPEIPESDILASDTTRPPTSHSTAVFHTAAQGESNSVPVPFSTAQTHLSAPDAHSPAKSPHKVFASQQSKLSASSDTPRRAAGVRRFADIAAEPSLPHASGETELDVDAIMSDIMTAEDREFIDAVSSPVSEKASKRRKITRTTERRVQSRGVSPEKVLSRQPVLSEPSEDVEELEEQVADPQHPTVTVDEADDAPGRPSNVLQSSPSKGNELPLSTPQDAEPPKGTQDSVKRREEAGAKAVSQLLSTRSGKPVKLTKLAGNGRKTLARTAEVEEDEEVPKKGGKRLKLKLDTTKPAGPTPKRGSRRAASDAVPQVMLEENRDGDAAVDNATTAQLGADAMAEADDQPVDHDGLPIVAPHRVLALFRGSFNNFYPANYLSTSADGRSYKVRFDDETVTNIEAQHVRCLDLHVGDQVKVDKVGMRSKVWTISGFGPVAQNDDERAIGTDAYGRTKAKVQAKTASRNSMSASTSGLALQDEGEVVDVLITNIYITHTMWPAFADRTFTAPAATGKRDHSRLLTPSTGLQTLTADAETPASRSRRPATLPVSKATVRRTSHLREESVASTPSATGTGLFAGMAFAISYGSNEAEKAEVTRHIQRNGGIILESGFDELFDLPTDLDDSAVASPQKRTPKKPHSDDNDAGGLRIKPEYAELGFVALIADRHSRRAKYMQALALGLPTLSGRWITDSLNASQQQNDSPLPWPKYLLPAGESSYLSGAVRSRTLAPYAAEGASLPVTIAEREILLNGDGVLLVAPHKKGKGTWERRKAYAFLTLALGAGGVKRVADLAEAKALVEDRDGGRWRWVYVDGEVGDACKVLFRSGVQKKRKRGDGAGARVDATAMVAADRDGVVKVVNDEFVVQSLILGALVD